MRVERTDRWFLVFRTRRQSSTATQKVGW